MTLYERLLGADFARLDPRLQAFHREFCARRGGQFCVRRSPGRLIGILARLAGLPSAGDDVPLRLEITASGESEVWRRSFGDRSMVTRQWLWRGLLIEAIGLVQLGLLVQVRRGGMTFRCVRAWLAGVPLPKRLVPRVTAVVLPAEEGWRVRVRAGLPLVGEVIRYEGTVIDACCSRPAAGARLPGGV